MSHVTQQGFADLRVHSQLLQVALEERKERAAKVPSQPLETRRWITAWKWISSADLEHVKLVHVKLVLAFDLLQREEAKQAVYKLLRGQRLVEHQLRLGGGGRMLTLGDVDKVFCLSTEQQRR